MNGISLFSSAGIGELLLNETKVKIRAACELLPARAKCYKFLHSEVDDVICGDIKQAEIKDSILRDCKKYKARFLIATPPCQGFSTLGKNKKESSFVNDDRNFLIFDTLEIIDRHDFDFILLENVPTFLKMKYPWKNGLSDIISILNEKYSDRYFIESRILNCENYGIPQSRPRAIVKLYKKTLKWGWPKEEKPISLRDSIGFLPPLDPGEDSGIKWHYAKKENPRIVEVMRHTATGESALKNEVFYPKKSDGRRISGFHNTFKRMKWDLPCPARTTYCGSMSSHNNVHPGRLLENGEYSDPRPLTLLETFIVSSIPTDISFPNDISDNAIRTLVGEGVPPLLVKKIVDMIDK